VTGRVQDKVAFITGAARGQGRSHAIRLAQEGADIIAVDLCRQVDSVPYPMATPEDLAATVEAVEGLGRRIVAREADVRDTASLQRVIDEGVQTLGRLDIVSANAGIVSFGAAHELPEQTWDDMIDTNLSGAWRTAKVAIPHLVAGGRGGSIVLTSSTAGLRAYAGVGHYVASKHGVVGLMRALALELAPLGVRVNSIHPTQVNTEMTMNPATWALYSPEKETPTLADFEAVSRTMIAMPTPWVEPSDISNALLFLASDEARFVTGVALPVDAGAVLV
jgi:(+)-trans-carveol dehydrogenase